MMRDLFSKTALASLLLVFQCGCQASKFFRQTAEENEPSYLAETEPFTSDSNTATLAETHALYDLGADTLQQQREVVQQHREGVIPAIPQVNDDFPFGNLPSIPQQTKTQSVVRATPFNSQQNQSADPYQRASSVFSQSREQPLHTARSSSQNINNSVSAPSGQPHPAVQNGRTASSQTPSTQVTIRGVRTNGGPVRIAVFDRASGFPQDESAAFKMVVQPQAATLVQSVPMNIQGPYALAVYQDVNDDRQLNKGSFGVPKEPYGFSRNAAGKYGPPKFADAALKPGEAIDVTLK